MSDSSSGPHIVVFSTLFPSASQPMAGLFIRERMFRVGRQLPITVVAPVPWFPFQSILRRFRPGFRPDVASFEIQNGVVVVRPRVLSVPGIAKTLDGFLMAVGCLPKLRSLQRKGCLDVLDAHFGYPEGYAASLLGRWLKVPVTLTLRGTEARHARDPFFRPLLRKAFDGASRVFAVSNSLRLVALDVGAPPDKVLVVGNGVDIARFVPCSKELAREALGLPADAQVLITVGGLVERKGFHRVIAAMPELLTRFTSLHYLIVGGPSPEGDWTVQLHDQVEELGLQDRVHFLGPIAANQLSEPLSAADVFVLSTRNEGWANVILEAMACGIPVVATDVGGNAEVVSDPSLGIIVPFDRHEKLIEGLTQALAKRWDSSLLRAHAEANTWDSRVKTLVAEFRRLARNDLP